SLTTPVSPSPINMPKFRILVASYTPNITTLEFDTSKDAQVYRPVAGGNEPELGGGAPDG
ncbi:hypothetical protein FRC10_001615, partial [Ceratobasidium sp. 414]